MVHILRANFALPHDTYFLSQNHTFALPCNTFAFYCNTFCILLWSSLLFAVATEQLASPQILALVQQKAL